MSKNFDNSKLSESTESVLSLTYQEGGARGEVRTLSVV